jgi:hypothetical protein
MFRILLIASLFLSCGEETNPTPSSDAWHQQYVEDNCARCPECCVEAIEEVWICHNPQSKSHGKLCTPECLEGKTGQSNFCWLIERDDCVEISHDWQRKNCHFFD